MRLISVSRWRCGGAQPLTTSAVFRMEAGFHNCGLNLSLAGIAWPAFFVARHCPCKCTMIVFEIAWRAKLALAKRYAHVAMGNAWWRLLFRVLFFRAGGFIANGAVCHGNVVDSKFAAYRGNVGAARRGCRFADRVRRSYLCCGLFPSWLPVLLQLPACTRVEPHLASGLRWVMGGWDAPSLGDTPRC